MEFFIKEFKEPKRWNALGEVIEYESEYAICRTEVWIWFAKLFPAYNIEFLYIDGNGNDGKTLVEWWRYEPHMHTPKTFFKDKEAAENLLEDMQANPDKYISKSKYKEH